MSGICYAQLRQNGKIGCFFYKGYDDRQIMKDFVFDELRPYQDCGNAKYFNKLTLKELRGVIHSSVSNPDEIRIYHMANLMWYVGTVNDDVLKPKIFIF